MKQLDKNQIEKVIKKQEKKSTRKKSIKMQDFFQGDEQREDEKDNQIIFIHMQVVEELENK